MRVLAAVEISKRTMSHDSVTVCGQKLSAVLKNMEILAHVT